MKYLTAFLVGSLYAVAAAGQPPDGYARARAVDVQAPGWVATRLDVASAAHLGVDLAVLAPDGSRLKVYRLGDENGRRLVRVTSLEPGLEGDRTGRWVRLDLGAEPPRHVRLEFLVDERTDAPNCVLQASSDGRTWTELSRGGLFRLGDDTALQRLALDYAASDARYLRLFWPESAGMPTLERVTVLAEGDAAQRLEVAESCVLKYPGRRSCTLRLGAPARQLSRIDLHLENADDVYGWRLWSARNGSWQQVAAGIRQPASGDESAAIRVAFDEAGRGKLLAEAQNPALRLELWSDGEGSTPPLLSQTVFWATRPSIAFRAEHAGRHQVVWGGRTTHGAFAEGMPEQPPAWIRASGTTAGPWPAIDSRLAGPGKAFDGSGFSKAWPVEFDVGVKPGDLVRLQLGVRNAGTRVDLLRLSHRGKLLPFVGQEMDVPEPGLSARLRPGADRDSTISRASLSIAPETGPATEVVPSQLLLRAPGPFSRDLTLGTERPGRRGRAATTHYALRQKNWRCLEAGPLPCVLERQDRVVGQGSETALELEVDDGGDLPLPWVDVEQWRPHAALLFVAPKGIDSTPVSLHLADPLVGDPSPGAARFDLEAIESLLRLRPHVPARLGVAETVTRPSPVPVGWLLHGAVVMAVLVLLALLGRMLREPAD
ncbi:MAG: DUF3999 domain-containing protein [Thermoanaerobaculia bacterium]|nr:DUF3999 domain-containing protein [Thermoanaerobaculia bacterium]